MPILGPISLLDCVVFVICLIPQLFIQAGLYDIALVVFKVLPFLRMTTCPARIMTTQLTERSIPASHTVMSRAVLSA